MLVLGLATWLLSLYLRDVSIVDSLWSIMFLASALVYVVLGDGLAPASTILLVLVTIWALRLSIFLTVRNWGEAEDRRYREIRANNQPNFELKSLYLIFGLQAGLAWIISVPLLIALTAQNEIGLLEIVALAIWLAGFLFEAIGDQQLYSFRSRPDNHGKVLDQGLWAYTRHPNYFGECLIWWAYYLFAVSAGGWWTIFAPVLMTLLLLKVSGVSLMERDISERRAAYREYIENTNAFIPGPPRRRPTISRSSTT
jgi:steroid 5-alpha reductase family enzyme